MVKKGLIVTGLILISCFLFLPNTNGGEIEIKLPPMPPSIETLTNGKVKTGDVITKDNVDLVKEYIPTGLYNCVKDGLVLRMAKNKSPEKFFPKAWLEATERNKGKAVMDDHAVVRTKDGAIWPGGIPFTDPKTGLEVMANARWGKAYADLSRDAAIMQYVNKEGKVYKTAVMKGYQVNSWGRLKVPPLGQIPGEEDIFYKFISVFVSPREMKGAGQFAIRHVDDTKTYDKGFMYVPAFKRLIRVSTTTWQDNVGGSDMTFGDGEGFMEPYGDWNFKLIEKKVMLTPEHMTELQPIELPDGSVDYKIETDKGSKYPRYRMETTPVYIVEATPKKRHIYGKKILYVFAPYFHTATDFICHAECYDRAGQLWKEYLGDCGGLYTHKDGDIYSYRAAFSMWDLYTGHSTHNFSGCKADTGIDPAWMSLNRLYDLGK